MKKKHTMILLGALLALTFLIYAALYAQYRPKPDTISLDIFKTIDSPDSRLIGLGQAKD